MLLMWMVMVMDILPTMMIAMTMMPQPTIGTAENDSETACMQDADGDGYGNATPENDAVESDTDCDDADAAVNPAEGNCTDPPE